MSVKVAGFVLFPYIILFLLVEKEREEIINMAVTLKKPTYLTIDIKKFLFRLDTL